MASRQAYRTRAVVLARTKLAEQDLILTLLTATGEQARAVAKGARKPGGRLAARTELFCETDFLLARGRTLDIVSEAAVVAPHATLRGDLDRVAAASAVAEIARLTCYTDAPDAYLYPICARALTACEEASDQATLDLVVAAYALKVLAHGGWRPVLDSCVACGDADVAYLSIEAGGTLCASCAKDMVGAEEVGSVLVAWLAALIGATFDELLVAEANLATSSWLVGFAHRWASTHLDARLRAWEFYLSL